MFESFLKTQTIMKSKIFLAFAAILISAGVMAQGANQQQKNQGKSQTPATQVQTSQPQVKEQPKTAAKPEVKKADKKIEKGKTGNSGNVKKAPEKK